MEWITKLLYSISTALFVPVVFALLFYFVRTLLLMGAFYHTWTQRLRIKKIFQPFLRNLETNPYCALPKVLANEGILGRYAGALYEHRHQEPIADKILADFELYGQRKLAKARTLAKMGPLLGLMGTLIPMGPALVGLAKGDITSLANNMQIAFATTVVGLFIGGIGFLIAQINQNWYNEELNDLQYTYALLNRTNDAKKTLQSPVKA